MSTKPMPFPRRSDPVVLQIASSWNAAYATSSLTNWEVIPPSDLAEFLKSCDISLRALHSILEVGCGRGLRALAAFLDIATLNRRDLQYTGVDISENAVSSASDMFEFFSGESTLPTEFVQSIRRYLPDNTPEILSQIIILNDDIFDYLRENPSNKFDLVIDWMCFHEFRPNERAFYAKLVASRCKQYFILNVFSLEGSTVSDLGDAVPGVPKYVYSEKKIRAIFGKYFEIICTTQYEEDLNPPGEVGDGIVSAKRCYLFRRKS